MSTQKQLAPAKTIRNRFDMSWEEVARRIDRHTMAVQAWLSTRAPKVDRFEGLGIKAGSTNLGAQLFNMALGCNFPLNTNTKTIIDEIQALKQFYTLRNAHWMWWVGPFPRPANLIELAAKQGLGFKPAGLPAMAAPLPAPRLDLNPEIRVWQAATRADLQAASLIRRTAFKFPQGAALSYFEDMADDWLRGDPAKLYLAGLAHNPPAAIGAIIMGDGIPGIYIMATLPAWGRRGLGQVIMTRLLSQAEAGDHQIIGLTAGDMGYPLYRKFGFEHIFNYAILEPMDNQT